MSIVFHKTLHIHELNFLLYASKQRADRPRYKNFVDSANKKMFRSEMFFPHHVTFLLAVLDSYWPAKETWKVEGCPKKHYIGIDYNANT